MKFVTKRLRWVLMGAGAAWLLDPELGPQRRERLVHKAQELIDKAGIRTAPVPASSPAGPPAGDVAWESATDTMPPSERPLAANAAR